MEEAGAVGAIEPQHFHLYLQPKGDSGLRNGIQEFVVKAFLLQVSHTQAPQEENRNPTWFSIDDARSALAMGREAKYADELRTVIDRAVERLSGEGRLVGLRPTAYLSHLAISPQVTQVKLPLNTPGRLGKPRATNAQMWS